MAKMGIRDTHYSVLSEVGIEPETVEAELSLIHISEPTRPY